MSSSIAGEQVTVTFDAKLPVGAAVELTARAGSSPRSDDPDHGAHGNQWIDLVRLPLYNGGQCSVASPGRAAAVVGRVTVTAVVSVKATADSHRWHLDEVVESGQTELERLVLLRNWVRRQWPHNDAGSGIRSWDAIEVLSAPTGHKAMCVHYGVAFTQCALALGYNPWQVILTGTILPKRGPMIWASRWAMDVETVNAEGWNRYGTAMYLDRHTGMPLSVLAIHRALRQQRAAEIFSSFT